MTRRTPRNKTVTLKLISKPRTQFVAFRYERTWTQWMGASASMGLSSTMSRSEIEAALADTVALVRDRNRNLAPIRQVT